MLFGETEEDFVLPAGGEAPGERFWAFLLDCCCRCSCPVDDDADEAEAEEDGDGDVTPSRASWARRFRFLAVAVLLLLLLLRADAEGTVFVCPAAAAAGGEEDGFLDGRTPGARGGGRGTRGREKSSSSVASSSSIPSTESRVAAAEKARVWLAASMTDCATASSAAFVASDLSPAAGVGVLTAGVRAAATEVRLARDTVPSSSFVFFFCPAAPTAEEDEDEVGFPGAAEDDLPESLAGRIPCFRFMWSRRLFRQLDSKSQCGHL